METIELVTVEVMPDHLASSHRAANNWGRYPFNGAERVEIPRFEVDVWLEDEYAHEVSSRYVAVLNGYRLSDPEEMDTVPSHESAEDWYDSLGYHISSDDGDHIHPICEFDEVQTFVPQNEWEIALHEYAKEAQTTALSVHDYLHQSVKAWEKRDLASCMNALDQASWLERQYGDDPATNHLRTQLLRQI